MAYDTQHDNVFSQAIDQRYRLINQCIEDLIPVSPHQQDKPGERVPNEPPNVDLRNECFSMVHNNWELVSQFADPSAGDAKDMIGNLNSVQTQNLEPINFGSGDGQLRDRVNAQLENQTWTGAGRDAFVQRLNDLILALASQEEVVGVLRSAMELHWSLLCAARAQVLAILDRTIRTLQEANQEQDDPFGTLMRKVWQETKDFLAELDVVGVLTEIKNGGPAGAVRSVAKGLGSSLLHLPLGELFGPDGDDPRPTLQAMLNQLRATRKATQEDSAKIAKMVRELGPYLSGDRHSYLVHEEGPVLPDPDGNTDEDNGGTTMQVDPNSLDRIALILTEARDAIQIAHDRMIVADTENGDRPFHEDISGGGRELMFGELKTEWMNARTVLEQALDLTVKGTEATCQKVTTAANMYRTTDLDNQKILMRIAQDMGLGQ